MTRIFALSTAKIVCHRSNVTAMQYLLLDNKGANPLLLTLAGADRVNQNEQERPHNPRRRPGVHLATSCRNVARNFNPVAQEFTISISRSGCGDPEPHCASGPSVECLDEP